MHYYLFNIGDYKSHTDHLEPLEDLAYRRMLDWCYLHESPLPESIDEIAKKICMRTHSDCIAFVLQEFFTLKKGGWQQDRIKKEIDAYHAKSEKAKASAMARWDKKPNKNNKKAKDANALRPDSERNAKQETVNNKQEPLNSVYAPYGFDLSLWPDLPDIELFNDWIKSKKKAKGSVSQRAMDTTGKALHKIKAKGHTVNDALEKAENGKWKGISDDYFQQKVNINENTTGHNNGQSSQSAAETYARATDLLNY